MPHAAFFLILWVVTCILWYVGTNILGHHTVRIFYPRRLGSTLFYKILVLIYQVYNIRIQKISVYLRFHENFKPCTCSVLSWTPI